MLNSPHLKKIKSKFVLKKPTKNKIEVESENFWIQSRNPSRKRKFESKAEIEKRIRIQRRGQNLQKKIPNPNSKPKSKFKVPAKEKNPKHRSAYKKENLKSELQKENPEAE